MDRQSLVNEKFGTETATRLIAVRASESLRAFTAPSAVGTDEVDLIALHSLEPDPDIGLDVFHDVADVESAVGVGECGRDEELARCGSAHWRYGRCK